jgi:hypothetical protein
MKTIYLGVLFIGICISGFGQSNKMSSKRSSESNNIIKESKSSKSASNKHVKPSYQSGKAHPSAKSYNKVEDVVVEKNLANAARVKKANYASSKKYKNRQQSFLNELNSNSQNSQLKGGRKKAYDGKFGF